jgi:Dynein light chain type 1
VSDSRRWQPKKQWECSLWRRCDSLHMSRQAAFDLCDRKSPSESSNRLACPSTSIRIRLTLSQFDERRGATWHCIVGRNFGSFVTHGKFPRCSCYLVIILCADMKSRNETLHLFLPGSLCHSTFQDPIAISLKRGCYM